MASKTLTLEISNELIKLCEVSHTGMKNIAVHKAVTIPTPEGSVEDGFLKNVSDIAEAIKLALKDNLIMTKDVVMTILSTKIASKEAVLPNVKPNRINDLVKANAAEYFPVNNIEDYSLTHTVLETIVNDKEKNLRILAMAAPLNIVTPYYELAKQAGLNVVAVDYLGNSTLQMLKLQIDEAPSMVIQIGNDSTIINVMKNRVLQFQRTVPYGRSAVVNAIMDTKKVSYQVAVELLSRGSIVHETFDGEEITESLRYLVNSISRIVDYYIARNQDSPIEKAYIMGDGASVIGIEKLLTNELNIDFTKITDLKAVEPDKFFRISRNELLQYMSTMGACLAPVNFAQASATKSKESKNVNVTKYLIIALVVSVLASLVLVAVPTIRYVKLSVDKKNYEEKVKNLEGARKTYNDYVVSREKRDNLQDFYVNNSSNNNDYLYEFMKDLEEVLPSDLLLTTISSKNGSVSMTGYCRDKATLARTLMQLKELPYVSNVVTPGGSEAVSPDGVTTVTFTVTCQFVNPVSPLDKLSTISDDKKDSKTNKETDNTKKEAE